MRDVVVIGAGLTGLAATHELERNQIQYTLIEVKRHLGGSITSHTHDGITLDAGAFALADTLDPAWLDDLGLSDALFHLDEDTVAFKTGTATLVEAIKARMSGSRLMRMAVSSIGTLEDGRHAICMENGLMFDAKALIVALPARWAQRIFYGYINALTEKLLDYRYDTIYRVSLACPTADIPTTLSDPPDMAYVYTHRTTHPARVPEGDTLLQFGLRFAPERVTSAAALVDLVRDTHGLPPAHAQLVGFWPEADPLSCYDDAHAAWVSDLRALLPPTIALVGSDYCLRPPSQSGVAYLDERIAQGRQAAQQIIANL